MRRYAYCALSAGAFGHTYGCLEVWQCYNPAWGHEGRARAALAWPEALDLPGARQMIYARRLLESRPFLTRVPDQPLISGDAGGPRDRVQATRDADGSYALVYTASGRPITVDTARLAGDRLAVWWLDPRSGRASAAGELPNRRAPQGFVPPERALPEDDGRDWVLVLDDAVRGFGVPSLRGGSGGGAGAVRHQREAAPVG